MKTYTTDGPVRGCCNHAHRSLETAQRCADQDAKDCSRHGGYSDRSVTRTDGDPISEGEYYALEDIARRLRYS